MQKKKRKAAKADLRRFSDPREDVFPEQSKENASQDPYAGDDKRGPLEEGNRAELRQNQETQETEEK